MENMFLIIVAIMYFGLILILPNLCLILFAKRSGRFKLANFAIFLLYLIPMIAPFVGWERLFRVFGLFVIPVAVISHFIFLVFAWQRLRLDRAWKITKFTASLFVMTVICSIVWKDVVTEYLY
ncbi:MAG TPA: hypothetical protein VKJ65_14715, partial [Phycisphaerae bacterium]|nr:hypothetical protein [Phycisphaerae bacterium]